MSALWWYVCYTVGAEALPGHAEPEPLAGQPDEDWSYRDGTLVESSSPPAEDTSVPSEGPAGASALPNAPDVDALLARLRYGYDDGICDDLMGEAADTIEALRAELNDARSALAVERVKARRFAEARDAARAALARVEALCAKWDRLSGEYWITEVVSEVRAALADPEGQVTVS